MPTGLQAPVVQRLDNAIHRINHYPLNRGIAICPADSVIQPLNNLGLESIKEVFRFP